MKRVILNPFMFEAFPISRCRSLLIAICSSWLFSGSLAWTSGAEEPMEGAPVFFARDLIDPSLLNSDCYAVKPVVEVQDFSYRFTVSCRHGSFVASGREELYKTLHELEVIEDLQEVSQTEAFAGAVTDSFADPLATTFGVARRPVASVIGLPGGIARYLGGKLYQVRRGSDKAVSKIREFRSSRKDKLDDEATDESEETSESIGRKAGNLSRKHLGHDSAKRKWARRLQVDPYSDNLALQDALSRIAWATSLGDFAGDFAVPSSEVFSYAGKTRELVWDRPAHQLEREIVATLKECGVDKELTETFRDSEMYSLTEKTGLCLAFMRIKDTGSVPFLVAFGLRSETKEDAALFLKTVEILVAYESKAADIASISERRGLLVASSKSGYDVYPLAVDYLHWTPLAYQALLSDELWNEKREIWVSGTVSPIARSRLRHHGWAVFEAVLDENGSSVAAR